MQADNLSVHSHSVIKSLRTVVFVLICGLKHRLWEVFRIFFLLFDNALSFAIIRAARSVSHVCLFVVQVNGIFERHLWFRPHTE